MNSDSFPVNLLPDTLARFATETAGALGCDGGFVALPALATIAGAIGTTRVLELKRTWSEPPILWVAVVARSGTLKSPALDTALRPLREAQAEAFERQTGERFIVSDLTLESLAPILAKNSRGVLVARDELSGWVGGFNQYKRRGNDLAGWLELWRRGTLLVDRKSTEEKTIHVRGAGVSVCGCLQPARLQTVLTGEHFDCGLVARLLLARPPVLEKRWTDRTPPREVTAEYELAVRELLRLKHDNGEPVPLPLSPDARPAWSGWYDVHAKRIAAAESDREAAALAKIEAYGARLALIFELVRDPGAATVGADAIRRGTELASWFAGEAARIYALLAETDEDREDRKLDSLIERLGGCVTARELTRHSRTYRDVQDAEVALTRRIQAGAGVWEYPRAGPDGGRPTKQFRLLRGVAVDKTPIADSASGGFVNGDGVNTVNAADEVGGWCLDAEQPPDAVRYADC